MVRAAEIVVCVSSGPLERPALPSTLGGGVCLRPGHVFLRHDLEGADVPKLRDEAPSEEKYS